MCVKPSSECTESPRINSKYKDWKLLSHRLSPLKKNLILLFFCIQFHAYNHFRVFNNSPMPVNMLLLACEIIALKRNLNYTADRALWKWFSEYIVLICECRHRLTAYASFTVTETHLKEKMRTPLKKLDIAAWQFHFLSLCALVPVIVHWIRGICSSVVDTFVCLNQQYKTLFKKMLNVVSAPILYQWHNICTRTFKSK